MILISDSALKGIIFREPNKNTESTPLDLEILNVGNNNIHTLDRKIFQYTPKLRVLYLNDNLMKVIDSATSLAISKITQLEVKNRNKKNACGIKKMNNGYICDFFLQVLDLSRNGLNVLPTEMMIKLKNLKELYLSGNKFTNVPNSIGSVSNSLIYLAINENEITELDDNSFLGTFC